MPQFWPLSCLQQGLCPLGTQKNHLYTLNWSRQFKIVYMTSCVVPSCTVSSDTCNASALAMLSIRDSPHFSAHLLPNTTSHVRTRAFLMLSARANPCHVSYRNAPFHHLHHQVHAQNSYKSTPPCAKWVWLRFTQGKEVARISEHECSKLWYVCEYS